MSEKNRHIECLLCQAKVAPNHYERDDCLELIERMSEVLKELVQEKEEVKEIPNTFYGLTLRD